MMPADRTEKAEADLAALRLEHAALRADFVLLRADFLVLQKSVNVIENTLAYSVDTLPSSPLDTDTKDRIYDAFRWVRAHLASEKKAWLRGWPLLLALMSGVGTWIVTSLIGLHPKGPQ